MGIRPGTPAPDLSGATEWFNGPVNPVDLLGHVTLVHFWSVSCHSCAETMPTVIGWHKKYAKDGLRMVAIHMPRQESDLDLGSVEQTMHEHGITWSVAVDNDYAIKDAFANEYVPAFYLFDHEGKLRHYQAGDKGLDMVEDRIRRALHNAGTTV